MSYLDRIDLPPTEGKIFHRMWVELVQLGRLPHEYGVICPLCLFPTAHEELTLEHIIARSALAYDPPSLCRLHHLNDRSGLTLLCGACNRLKGKWYDPIIATMFRFPRPPRRPKRDGLVLKARRTLGYLAAFRELGYQYIFSNELDGVRKDFLYPEMPPITTGINFITAGIERQYPHAYFDGWCDTYDDDGNRTNSVFACHFDPMSDTVQVRVRHLTVTLPAGARKIIIPRKPGAPPNTAVNMSLM